MTLYLDIDGVLLNYDSDARAEYSIELIDYITNEFDLGDEIILCTHGIELGEYN